MQEHSVNVCALSKIVWVDAPWIFLGGGQLGEGTAYAEALRELGFLAGQVAQYFSDSTVARKKVGWVSGMAVRKGLDSERVQTDATRKLLLDL